MTEEEPGIYEREVQQVIKTEEGPILVKRKQKRLHTGLFIRDYYVNRKNKKDWPYHVWREYQKAKSQRGHRTSTANSFYHYFYVLRELGLIEFVDSEPLHGKIPPIPRRHHRIVPGMEYNTPDFIQCIEVYHKRYKKGPMRRWSPRRHKD